MEQLIIFRNVDVGPIVKNIRNDEYYDLFSTLLTLSL